MHSRCHRIFLVGQHKRGVWCHDGDCGVHACTRRTVWSCSRLARHEKGVGECGGEEGDVRPAGRPLTVEAA